MQCFEVRNVLCRKAHGGREHLLTLIVDIQRNGQTAEHPVSFFKLWRLMGWQRWSARRIEAVKATAPKRVHVWWTRRRGQPWAELLHTTYEPWCARIKEYLDKTAPETQAEPSALEVAQDAALVVFRNDSAVEPFVIEVGTHS
jgi:hypothetical protein